MKKFIYILIGAFLINIQVIQAAVVQMEREEVIQRSEMIFVGEVRSKKSRWNTQGNLIVTDYEFSIDEVLFGQYYADELTLTFAGGQLPEEGQSLSDVPEFAVDEEVLLMLESPIKPLISPVTGLYQGKFSASENKASVIGGLGEVIKAGHSTISFDEFVEQIKQEIPLAKSKALPSRKLSPGAEKHVIKDLPVKSYDSDFVKNLSASVNTTRPHANHEHHSMKPSANMGPVDSMAMQSTTLDTHLPEQLSNRWSYDHPAKFTPIVYNQLGPGGLLGLHDEYQMSYWNDYSDIFQVHVNPPSTWAWQNNVYDIAGFVNNQTMIDQFGQGWGANTLAICWLRWDGTGLSIEADIAVNPAFNWSVDDYATYSNNGLYNANRTLLHELGHAWGLNHQFEELSVMNYAPKKYRAYTVLYGDDVMAVRNAFPGTAVSQTDFSISLFHSPGFQNYDDATLSSTNLTVGDTFEVSDFVLENSGTAQASTTINWYLTHNINDWIGATFIGSTVSGNMNPDSYFHLDNIPVTIPTNLPAGNYYLAANINSSVDTVLNNNSSWLDRVITVQGVQTCADDGWENMGSGGTDDFCSGSQIHLGFTQAHLHCDADWVHFNGQAGATYRIETSNLNGGADTTMSLQKECGAELAFDDDGGTGRASQIDWTVTETGRYDVRIRQFNDDYANGEYYEFNVTCIANCNDTIFTNGFD